MSKIQVQEFYRTMEIAEFKVFRNFLNKIFPSADKKLVEENTQLKLAIQEARHKESLLEIIIDNAPVAIFMKDRDQDFRYCLWNKTSENLWGFTKEQVLGKYDYDIFPKSEADFFRAKDIDVLSSNQPLLIPEETITLANGKVHFLKTIKVPIENRYLLGVSEDITNKREQDKSLHTLYSMIQESNDIFAYIDLSGKPLFINNSAINNLGWVNNSSTILNFLPPETAEKHQLIMLPYILQTGEQWQGEVILKNLKNNEEVPYLLRVFGLKDEKGEFSFYAMSGRDLRERKHWEATMMSSAKMSALGEMAAGIAHELNNPLSIIMGKSGVLLSYLKKGNLKPEMGMEELEKIILTAERMAKIIKGLRLFSRNGNNDEFERIEVKKLITDVTDICATKFQNEDVKLNLELNPDLYVDGKNVQLGQVIMNLLSNSLDAVSSKPEKWVLVQANLLKEQDQVQISITDSGAGISPAIAERMMEPFYTTKDVGKGTGLGLSISKGIIEGHHGKLWLDTDCKNTRFVIEIPIHQTAL